MTIQIQSIHFSADQKLKNFIEKKLNKLDQFFDRIISADVHLKLENAGQIKDKITEINLRVPGSVLFAKETAKTFEESADKAINSLKKQLLKHKLRRKSKDTMLDT